MAQARTQGWGGKSSVLPAILLLCVTLRLVVFILVRPWEPDAIANAVLRSDAQSYHALGLAAAGQESPGVTDQLRALRTPLYPLFIGGIYRVAGVHPYAVLVAQIALDTLSCGLLFAAVALGFGRRPAIVAALLYAIHPFFILFSNILYSDILFVCLLLAAYVFLARILARRDGATPANLIAAAFFMGLATLTRPIAVYVPVVVLAVLLPWLWADKRRIVLPAAVFLVTYGLVLLPWLLHNQARYGAFALSTTSAFASLAMLPTSIEMERRGITDRVAARDRLFAEADDMMMTDNRSPEEMNEFERAVYWRRLGFEVMRQNPLAAARHYTLGLFRMFAALGTGEYAALLQWPNKPFEVTAYTDVGQMLRDWLGRRTGAQLALAAVIGGYLVVCYLLFIVGIIRSRHYNHYLVALNLLLGVYFLLLAAPGGQPRYSLPVFAFWLPIMAIGAAGIKKT